MKVSVVLASYNGEKYIKRQLISLMLQDRKADEVIICDDCSTDGTVKIVKNFIKENELNNWKIYINSQNIGWKKNFYNAINKTTGDLIFLADQDDEWYKNKISVMEQVILRNLDIELLVSNFDVEYLDKSEKVQGNSKKIGNSLVAKLDVLDAASFRILRPGCTFAFKRSVLDCFNNLWFEECPHDLLLWEIGILNRKLYLYNKSLMVQVRHEGNNTPSNKKTKKNRCQIADLNYKVGDKFLVNYSFRNIDDKEWIKEYTHFSKARFEAINSGNILKVIKLLKYRKHYYSLKMWIGDAVSTIR